MKKTIRLLFLLCLLLPGCISKNTIPENNLIERSSSFEFDGAYCIPPGHQFFYQVRGTDNLNDTNPREKILPSSPWTEEITLPDFPEGAIKNTSRDWIVGVFDRNEGKEIWVLRSWTTDRSKGEFNNMEILVINTKTGILKNIPGRVEGRNVFAGALFMTKDKKIWARNYWNDFFTVFEPPFEINPPDENDSLTDIPLLSTYDPETNQFKFVTNTAIQENSSDDWNKVILDENDVFWIFVQGEGIYSYDPEIANLNQHAAFNKYPEGFVVREVASDETGLYYSDGNSALFRFDPVTKTNEMIGGIPLPFEDKVRLNFHGFVVDQFDRLWFGNIGWTDLQTAHNWYQLFPSPIFVGETDQLPNQILTPRLILESKDNRLWYSFSNGMVFMDPDEEQWCWFTTEKSNIVEDVDGNLWMIADDKVYKNPIGEN